jgi:hypothetical protein
MAKVDLANIDRYVGLDIQKIISDAFNDGIDSDIPLSEGKSVKFQKADGTFKTLELDTNEEIAVDGQGVLGLVKVVQTEVDCSGGGQSQDEVLATLPSGATLLNVVAVVTEQFDGDSSKTFEVGVDTNEDKYIDSSDLGSSADSFEDMINGANNDQGSVEAILTETEIKAFWTNHDNATTGKVKVTIIYI